MKKLLRIFLTIGALSQLNDVARAFEYKDWKIFQNDYGYEIKIPACWKIQGGYPDSGPIMETNFEISAGEDETKESCKSPRIDTEKPNSIGVYVERTRMTNAQAKKEMDSEENGARIAYLKNKEYLVFKRFKLKDGTEVLAHVENGSKLQPYARWHYEIYCPNRKMKIGGPTVRAPSKELLEKFEKGDLAIPEPYKTIYESFKCTEPKIK